MDYSLKLGEGLEGKFANLLVHALIKICVESQRKMKLMTLMTCINLYPIFSVIMPKFDMKIVFKDGLTF